MNAYLTFIQTLSPLHAGTGQGVGVIDLPVAREKATNLPFLPGSTLKGSLRDEIGDDVIRDRIFGPANTESDSAYSGSIIFSDQKLLCLPVRSLLGTFAWITSPYILERFKRDCESMGLVNNLTTPSPKTTKDCIVSTECEIKTGNEIILEDLDLTVQNDANADEWANWLAGKIFQNENWQVFFKRRFCIVSDDVMNFLAETATEVIARNKLDDEKKATVQGALWYEESLPSETILSGLLVSMRNNEADVTTLREISRKALQFGGSMTVGRGLCRLTISQNGGNN
ncbi:MAG TPA: type III-B CRISPR module RAMP protein Cmr4 [Pyrinomonadaceae bacterium]|jgi:CRISPR-associated protein Cmr4